MTYLELFKATEEGVFVIAEAGVNHGGDEELARRMIDAAKEAGAGAVKFQTWITEKVYSPERSIKPEYQKVGTDPAESEFETVKRLELSFEAMRRLKSHADEAGLMLLSTPDETASADFLFDELNLPLVKVSSQDINNLPFLRYLAGKDRPLILSTGTATLAEVAMAVETIQGQGNDQIFLFHCTSCYPAQMDEVNLRAITTMRQAFKLPVGYSDHTLGDEVACAALALGAGLFEKHFTLSHDLVGPDQQAALEPEELKGYIKRLGNIRQALGDGVKRPSPTEMENKKAMRRFLAAGREIAPGEIIGPDDLLFMKIAKGLPPRLADLIVGHKAARRIASGEPIGLDMIDFTPQAGCGGEG